MSTIGVGPVVSYFKFGFNESPLRCVSVLFPVKFAGPLDPAPMNDVPVAETSQSVSQSGTKLKTGGNALTWSMPAGLEDPESHIENTVGRWGRGRGGIDQSRES